MLNKEAKKIELDRRELVLENNHLRLTATSDERANLELRTGTGTTSRARKTYRAINKYTLNGKPVIH